MIYIFTIAGTPYTQQSYKVSESFPYKWINKKWKEGFHVTSMATAGNRWGVVMSRNSGYSNQVTTIAWPYAFFVPHAYLFIFLWAFPLTAREYLQSIFFLELSGCRVGFPVPKRRHPSAMGDWLQDNFHSGHQWPSCFHLEHAKAEADGWDTGNPSDLFFPQWPCEGTPAARFYETSY